MAETKADDGLNHCPTVRPRGPQSYAARCPGPEAEEIAPLEETGKTFRMASRAVPRSVLCKIKAIMDGLIGEAEATSNPFDASWQSINGGGFDGTWGANIWRRRIALPCIFRAC